VVEDRVELGNGVVRSGGSGMVEGGRENKVGKCEKVEFFEVAMTGGWGTGEAVTEIGK
jgi:hypothetical protein